MDENNFHFLIFFNYHTKLYLCNTKTILNNSFQKSLNKIKKKNPKYDSNFLKNGYFK